MNRKNILNLIFVFLLICGVCSGKKEHEYSQKNIDLCADIMSKSIEIKTTVCYPNIQPLFKRLCKTITHCVDYYVYDETWCGIGYCENKCIGELKDIVCEWDNYEALGYIYNEGEKFKCHAIQYIGGKKLQNCYP